MDKAIVGSGVPQRSGKVPWWRAQQGTWLVAAVAWGLFLLLALAISLDRQPYFSWDLAISRAVQATLGSRLEVLMHGIALAGDDALWSGLLVAVAGLVLLALRAGREAGVLCGVVLVGQTLKIVSKLLVGRPRPSSDLVQVLTTTQEVYSFPSGHTVHYVVFFGFLWFLTFLWVKPLVLRWLLLSVFGGLVLLIGLARVSLGAHWVSDVVGGYLLGGAVLAAGIGVYRC